MVTGLVSAGINVMLPPPQPITREELALPLNSRDAIYWSFGLLLGATLFVSLDALRYAGIARPDTGVQRVEVRGRVEQLDVLAVEDPASLLVPVDQ